MSHSDNPFLRKRIGNGKGSRESQDVLKAMVIVAQKINKDFETLASDCDNSNGHGGCLINTADGCLVLGCPLAKEED